MVQVLFFILKVIGWIILGILGLILGILLFVLFSAVRYRIKGKKDDKPEGQIRITWLLWIVSITISYHENLLIQVKLFGKTIWKLDSKEDEQKETAEPEWPESAWLDEAGNNRKDEPWTGKQKDTEAERKKDVETDRQEKIRRQEEEKQKEIRRLEKQLNHLQAEKERPVEEESETLWEKLKAKIAAWIDKLKFSFAEFCDKLKQIEERRQQLEEKWAWLCGKWDKLSTMVQDPANQKSVRLIVRQMKKLTRHVLPRKGTASIVFGREDPYTMGKLLSCAAVFYPFTHKYLTIYPIFGQNQLKGEVDIRGHIRLGVILGYILRLLFNKNIRKHLFGLLRSRKT